MKLHISLGRRQKQPTPPGLLLLLGQRRIAQTLVDWQRELETQVPGTPDGAQPVRVAGTPDGNPGMSEPR